MSEYNYMNRSFLVKSHFTPEQALDHLKERAPLYSPRASTEFKNALRMATLESLKVKIKYAPIYHVFTKGEYSWTETGYKNIGNAYVGNIRVGIDHIKRSAQSLNLTIDKSDDTGFWLLHLDSYQKDDGDVLQPITNEKALSLPLLYPMLSSNAMVQELHTETKKAHRGEYNISDLEILLALVPVACFQFEFNGQIYHWSFNLYSGKMDVSDVDVAPVIESTYQKCKKVRKIATITQIAVIAAFILDLILIIVKTATNSFAGATDMPSMIIFWILSAIVPALLIFLPFKKQQKDWENLSDEYAYDDTHIANNGKLRLKAILSLSLYMIQIIVPAALAIFISLVALSF